MECKRCGNQDTKYFAYDPFHENWYCRKCIAFGRINVNEPIQSKRYQTCNIQCHYELESIWIKARMYWFMRHVVPEKLNWLWKALCALSTKERKLVLRFQEDRWYWKSRNAWPRHFQCCM